jgi:hypothetical protein
MESPIEYRVVPFTANVEASEGAAAAARQLQDLIDQSKRQGWAFERLETITTDVTTPAVPGDNGCLGIGATPGIPAQRGTTETQVAVFTRPGA